MDELFRIAVTRLSKFFVLFGYKQVMSNCYLCGSSEHLKECPRYGLLVSVLVSETEKVVKIQVTNLEMVIFKKGSTTWRIEKMKPGDAVPAWAKRGWFLFDQSTTEGGITDNNSTTQDLAIAWANSTPAQEIGWDLNSRGFSEGTVLAIDYDGLALFAPLSVGDPE